MANRLGEDPRNGSIEKEVESSGSEMETCEDIMLDYCMSVSDNV